MKMPSIQLQLPQTPSSITSMFTLKTIMIVVIIISTIIGLVVLYSYLTSNKKVSFKENSEHMTKGSAGGGKEAEILMFSTDWCPHCKSAKPEWEQAKTEFEGKTVNGYTIIFTDVNCTNESPDVEKMMNQYKVEGFPTIKMVKDGNVVDFDAKPTKANLSQFINATV